jgi:S-adenosylmethionine-diacylglycerol 3-amino-3-carboxypropyl transferase
VRDPGLAYSQAWEDPAVLIRALRLGPEDDALSICGAGDNPFALVLAGARSVLCVDTSEPQLALAEYKLRAAQALPLQSFRSALGLDAFGRRVWFYHHVRPALGPRAIGFLDAHEDLVREGLVGAGAFERGLRRFREQVLSRIHPAPRIERMLALEDPDAQAGLYSAEWDTVRWRGLFRLAFDRRIMARRGRAPDALSGGPRDIPAEMHGRAARVLCDLPAAPNFFLQWYLAGRYPDLERGPPYLTTAGHAALKARGDRLRFVAGDVLEVLRGCASDSLSAFNLSNIFEYMDEAQLEAVLHEVSRVGRPGARICYWNLLVDRHRPASLADRIERDEPLGRTLTAGDRAFVYGAVRVERVR